MALLAALLAYLKHDRDVGFRRILFIAEHAEAVMHWLSAATLLIPQQEALRIGFKVFTADPGRSKLPVVAVHPEWARSAATIEDDRGYAVFDLVRHQWTTVSASPEAQHWARLFCEADPYDVSEAVELAAVSGLTGEAARDLATAAVLGRAPSPANAGALTRWLQDGPVALREAYGGTLVGALARLRDITLLLRIDNIAEKQFPGRRDEVRLALLRYELNHALQGQPPPRRTVPLRTVSAAAEAEAARLVTEALRRAREMAFDAVLRVGAQFGVSVPLDTVSEAAAAFVEYWADSPAAGYDPSGWPADPPVYDMLRDELSGRILNSPSTAAAIADSWWNWLWRWTPDRADITLPLHRALLSAAMANSNFQTRLGLVRVHLARCREHVSDNRYRDLAAVLWARTEATTEELRALCGLAPDGTEFASDLFVGIVSQASANPAGLRELELCADLSQKQLLALDAATDDLVSAHLWLVRFESHLSDEQPLPEASDRLRQTPAGILAAHTDRLVHLLIAIDEPLRVMRVIDALPSTLVVAYLFAIHVGRTKPVPPSRLATIFALFKRADSWWAEADPDGELREGFGDAISAWCRAASKPDIQDVTERLDPVGAGLAEAWNDYTARNRRSHFRRPPMGPGH